jgi:hypothetical protein
MSLDFRFHEVPESTRTIVAEYDDAMRGIKVGDRIMNPVTETLIWLTMAVGIGVLNDDTIPEFQARLDFLFAISGRAELLQWNDGDEAPTPKRITIEDLQAHKSLSTNVFPLETRSTWIKRILEREGPFVGVKQPKKR